MPVKPEKLKELGQEIPYHYKPQSVKNGKASCVSYIDARDAEDLLDKVVGPENWQDKFEVINDNLYCSVGICIDRGEGQSEWIWKSDCGVESFAEKIKGESSDAFKRACVKWKCGRFLYSKGIVELKTAKYNDKEYPATDEGKILWGAKALNDYINNVKLKQVDVEPAFKVPEQKTEPTETKPVWSEEMINKVKNLEKDGKKAKTCLKAFIPKFNDKEGTTYKTISQFDTDEKLQKLITFIEESIPEGI